ncbi:MAG: hypothetical protein JZU64_09925 [Rhodoferax sp.]|nr:hypothetical protein [Rhodoferax sp.]
MKTATRPPVRVLLEFRAEIGCRPGAGETLSELLPTAVRNSVQRRQHQQEFVRRGLTFPENAKLAGAAA